jgi:membrane protein implicated in regulation of membrane protease activity
MDVRLPIGALFVVIGALVGGYGLATAGDAEQYARSASININLWWGAIMFLFGALLLLLAGAARRKSAAMPATATPQGRATEEREHRSGLES